METKRKTSKTGYKIFTCTLVILTIFISYLTASTSVPEGHVSGTWTLSSSPYLIEGDITVPAGQTLTIEPGVVVEFQNWYGLTINGKVQAVGTSSQQIVFTATPPGPGEPAWHGIDIIDATSDSRFEYCIVENGQSRGAAPNNLGAAFYILNSNPVIKYCTLRSNNAGTGGGAIYCDGGNPVIEGCTIADNYSKSGGAVYCTNYAEPQIIGNIIINNSASASGGFSPTTASGGAIYLYHCDALIKNNVFNNNSVQAYGNVGTHSRGGAIYSRYSNPTLVGNTIYGNDASGAGPEGGAIYVSSGNVVSVNNILWGNTPEEVSIFSYGTGSILFAYSDVEGGEAGIAVDNSIIYWQEGNISSDPLFTNIEGGDFSLQDNSPAMDAGTAYYEWQGNIIINLDASEYEGSAPDMGGIESGGSGGANQAPVAVATASTNHGSSPLTIDFSSEGSHDPDGSIVSYQWDFGDGNTSTELNPSHTFIDIDRYSVRLIVTDNDGATNTNTIVIEVQDGTTLAGGDVSGTWTLAGSPYRVEGDITVPAGATLNIEPGVTVDFIDWFSLTVNGTLQANGSESQPVLFTSAAVAGWKGIYFINAPDGSLLEYCIVENGKSRAAAPYNVGGAAYMLNSNPVIRNSILRNNLVSSFGGALYCDNSNPLVEGCNITNNSAHDGGAIYCTNNSQPQFRGNTISYNSSSAYGGYSPATAGGGGIYLSNSDALFEKNVISHNTVYASGNVPSHARGAALYVNSSNPQLIGNTIYGNSASGANPEGGAIYLTYSDVEAVNNILWDNLPQEVSIYSSGSVLFVHSDVEGGETGIVNDNGFIYWQEGNIDSDPQFSDVTNNNLSLLNTSSCVNAGTAYYEWQGKPIVDYKSGDYIGSAPDMGALESTFTQPSTQPPVAVASANPISGDAPLTVQFSSTSSYDIDGTITGYLWSAGSLSTTTANPSYTFTNPGTYVVTLEVTDDDGAKDNDELTIEVLESISDELHVGAQAVSRERLFRRFFRAVDQVQILDQNNQPVSGVSVKTNFSGPTSGTISGITDSDGIVTLYSYYAWRPRTDWCFEVSEVSKNGYSYSPDDNVVTIQCEGAAQVLKSTTISANETEQNIHQRIDIPVTAYPNPFTDEVKIVFGLSKAQEVSIFVYDITGKIVASVLEPTILNEDFHEIVWNVRNTNSKTFTNGIYYLRINSKDFTKTIKLIKVK